jgi:hypothetical protein
MASISSVIFIVPICAAKAEPDHDRGHQHAELADGDPADEVDGVDLGPELGELHRALLGDDDPDQEAHQADDAERAHPDHVEALHHCIHAEFLRPADDIGEGDQGRTKEAEQPHQGGSRFCDPLAKLAQDGNEVVRLIGSDLCRLVELLDLPEQANLVAACSDHLGAAVANGTID